MFRASSTRCLATTCTQTGEVFGRATLGAIQSASLAVGLIGQGPALARRRLTKHAVKQVDRLLSNEGIEFDALLAHLVPYVVGVARQLVWVGCFSVPNGAERRMTRLDREARVTIKTLVSRGTTNTAVARLMGVTEGSVRYHVSRMVTGAVDGRGMQPFKAAPQAEAIEHWRQSQRDGALNLAALHSWLVAEHGYDGSLRSVQRFWAKHYPAPAIRARRRVETPPGVQAQADWAHFPQVVIGGEVKNLIAFKMVLSHSRKDAIVWSESKDMLSWLGCHSEAFRRLGGVPATVRIDNEEDRDSQRCRDLGPHQQELSPLRDDATLSCRCMPTPAATMQGEDRATGARPAVRHRSSAISMEQSRGPTAMDGRATDSSVEPAGLPGNGPDGGGELGGGTPEADTFARGPAGTV